MIEISVLIPVYNADKYVREAVESALIQPETTEVVLVDDGSTDGSLSICMQLAAEDERVKVFQHADKQNHGEAATRNLLLEKSTGSIIAFLDADDYFVPNRFQTSAALLASDETIEGVYEALENFVENEDGATRAVSHDDAVLPMVIVEASLTDDLLFQTTITSQYGSYVFPALTLRRSVFDKIGQFPPLRISTDRPQLVKLAAHCRMVAGELTKPVTMRRIHANNLLGGRRLSPNEQYKIEIGVWKHMLWWAHQHFSPQQRRIVVQKVLSVQANTRRIEAQFPALPRFLVGRIELLLLLKDVPALWREWIYWRQFLPHGRK